VKPPGSLHRDVGYDQAGYSIIRGLVGPELVAHLVGYSEVLRDSGRLEVDQQVPGSLRRYGSPGFDALLDSCASDMSAVTGHHLVPTYSFMRFYRRDQTLVAHRDRPECEHSATVHLGSSERSSWPIWIRRGTNDAVQISLRPGDAVIYRGAEVLHWREPLEDADWYLQVFLHYVDGSGPHADRRLDGRPHLGGSPDTRGRL